MPQSTSTAFPFEALDIVLSGRSPHAPGFRMESAHDGRKAMQRADGEVIMGADCMRGNVHRVLGLWLTLPFACWAQGQQTSPAWFNQPQFFVSEYPNSPPFVSPLSALPLTGQVWGVYILDNTNPDSLLQLTVDSWHAQGGVYFFVDAPLFSANSFWLTATKPAPLKMANTRGKRLSPDARTTGRTRTERSVSRAPFQFVSASLIFLGQTLGA
jgi:hypothetical protein